MDQKILKVSPHFPENVSKMSSIALTIWRHEHQEESGTPDAQLKLRVKFCLGDKLTEGFMY